MTGREPTETIIEAAHIRYVAIVYGKRETGKAEKPHDIWTVPLCQEQHRLQHHGGDEREFWNGYGIDPVLVSALLWAHSGNERAARLVLSSAKLGNLKGEYDGSDDD